MMANIVMLLGALVGITLGHHTQLPQNHIPLALVGDRLLSVARHMSEVPLLLVPSNELSLYQNVHISSVSDTQPLVTCQTNNRFSENAVPAVRVVLRQPFVMNDPEAYLPFPSEVHVIHEGLRMSVPVGALIVPIPSHHFQGPTLVRVMYAVPTGPLQLQYPVYSNSPVPYPLRPEYAPVTSTSQRQVLVSRPGRPTASYKPPHNDLVSVAPKRPPLPVVTILNFPSEIATPETLFYQPPIDDNGELGNRNPPEAVIPAGIVQSSQPSPSLQVFLNSKEHPILQSLRDQAEANRDKAMANSISVGVESL